MEKIETFKKGILLLHKPFLKFIKTKNLPSKLPERYVLASNHLCYTDGPFLFLLWYWRYQRVLATFAHEKYFNKWFLEPFLRWGGCIKVGSSTPGDSLKHAYKEKRKCFCIFPEGRITKERIKPKTGCIRLSQHHKIPIIPIRIKKRGFLKREIIFGEPLHPSTEDIHKESEILLNRIYSLN
jgi:1-acyl-sn-glycerol-3-phosphate acyltransferase